jgi:hypothetical protein
MVGQRYRRTGIGMNKRLRELMLEAGYAAPELAGRANKLADLIVGECAGLCSDPVVVLQHFGLDSKSE